MRNAEESGSFFDGIGPKNMHFRRQSVSPRAKNRARLGRRPCTELDFCLFLWYNTIILLGWFKAMNEIVLTLFVMLLFLVGVTTK